MSVKIGFANPAKIGSKDGKKLGSSALPVLNNIKVMKLPLASRTTEISQAHRGRFSDYQPSFCHPSSHAYKC